MKSWIVRLLFCLPLLSACVLEEAPVDTKRKLTIHADHLTAQDSLFLTNYAKKHQVDIQFLVKSAAHIKTGILQEKYSYPADVILLSDEFVMQELRLAGYFQTINQTDIFEGQQRQFANTHHQILPLCHNPLLVTSPKDSAASCIQLNFDLWHRKDSLYPKIELFELEKAFAKKIEEHPGLWQLYRPDSYRTQSQERIIPLTHWLQRSDSQVSNSMICVEALTIKKRYITLVTGLAILKFSSNKQEAHRFLSAFQDYQHIFSAARKQVPTNKKVAATREIQDALAH